MNVQLLLFTLIFSLQISYAQKVKTPKTIGDAIEILNRDCSDSLKKLIKKTANDSLSYLCYPWGGDYKTVFNWTDKDNRRSKIREHLVESGIENNQHQQTVILVAFKRHLQGDTAINEKQLVEPYRKIEDKWRAEDKVRFSTDTLRGVYIPKDLEDCFRQIDMFWDDSTKNQVKLWTEDEFSARAHLGFGMWMRNNWQLWGGSRLSKYFNDHEVYHPDNMSGMILRGYHRYLMGQAPRLEDQIERLRLFKKVAQKPAKTIYPEGVRRLKFDKSLVYRTKEDSKPGQVHVQTNSKSNKTWIYDYHFGWKHLSQEELSELLSTTYENRESSLKKLFGQ